MSSIPTTYNGIRFRSRLEAKWACYFDLMGERSVKSGDPAPSNYPWEYEPVDMNGWIPDFSVKIAANHLLVLCEVKPIYNIDELTQSAEWRQVVTALQDCKRFGSTFDSLAVLGVSSEYSWVYLDNYTFWSGRLLEHVPELWKKASNTVQWKAPA